MKIEIPAFNKAKVLIVGDLMLDSYLYGSTSRVSPEAPVPIVEVCENDNRAGGAANVALNITSLGGQAFLLGLVGNDPTADALADILRSFNVDYDFCRIPDFPTIKKLRVVSHNQQLIRLDFEKKFHNLDFSCLLKSYKEKIKNFDVVILSDYGKGTLGCSKELIDIANDANVPVIVDPKGKDFSIYRRATIVKPNINEFEAVVGKCSSEDDIKTKALTLINKYELKALLVTRGADGMTLVEKDGNTFSIPTHAREVFDVTGAGDTVTAILGASLAAGENLYESIILANAAAGIVVKKFGTSSVSIAELRRAMQRQQDPWAAILTEAELLQQVKDAKKHGEKIVMTNGCFDILHSGHVIYLEKARSLGDRLIIAVNDDLSVKRLKGPTRPLNNLEARMLILASLRAVDWVVPFSEDTPDRLIKAVTPDILAKGGDYKAEEVVGYDHVTKFGGKVVIVPFEEGFSTTGLINNIKNK